MVAICSTDCKSAFDDQRRIFHGGTARLVAEIHQQELHEAICMWVLASVARFLVAMRGFFSRVCLPRSLAPAPAPAAAALPLDPPDRLPSIVGRADRCQDCGAALTPNQLPARTCTPCLAVLLETQDVQQVMERAINHFVAVRGNLSSTMRDYFALEFLRLERLQERRRRENEAYFQRVRVGRRGPWSRINYGGAA